MIFVISHSGFTVKFDTDGGSYIEPVKAMHSETVAVENPVKEGFFYRLVHGSRLYAEMETDSDTVTDSMTLYAGWEKVG